MARPLRLVFENAHYHVISRGIRKDDIFFTDRDREVFLEKIEENLIRYRAQCFAYCLMNTHYHLFIKTHLPNLPELMHSINSSYINWLKTKHNIAGPVLRGRYKSILVDADSYATVLSAYIHLNPLRGGFVDAPEEYRWSSFHLYLDHSRNTPWLDTDFILSYFSGDIAKYRDFVYKQQGRNLEKEIYNGCILGDENLIERMQKKLSDKKTELREIPMNRELSKTVKPDKVLEAVCMELKVSPDELQRRGKNNQAKKIAVYLIAKYTSHTLTQIGSLFKMDYSAVSQLKRRFEVEAAESKEIQDRIKKICAKLEMSNVET